MAINKNFDVSLLIMRNARVINKLQAAFGGSIDKSANFNASASILS